MSKETKGNLTHYPTEKWKKVAISTALSSSSGKEEDVKKLEEGDFAYPGQTLMKIHKNSGQRIIEELVCRTTIFLEDPKDAHDYYILKDFEFPMPKSENVTLEFTECLLGIYRVRWRSGGESIASVGVQSDGDRWIAPANWFKPTTLTRKVAELIESMEKIPILIEE